ncbi:uncharacterized protein LOC122075443 isoform X3 [Macadamia integrifolia]|uniref:uncharacterized protein LOC122075443 isoform X3 n=1 Tax=Macadamia integrifolia TaxID=60698 RepID=UPI001C502251|nr:uncharacterized protein LOC122075443 isoform X3 [Macadamia integrifolia]
MVPQLMPAVAKTKTSISYPKTAFLIFLIIFPLRGSDYRCSRFGYCSLFLLTHSLSLCLFFFFHSIFSLFLLFLLTHLFSSYISLFVDQLNSQKKNWESTKQGRAQESCSLVSSLVFSFCTFSFPFLSFLALKEDKNSEEEEDMSSCSDVASEQVCYIPCNFCNIILAVSVPCSSLFDMVTVRCGHCGNLWSVNMAAALQSLSWQDPQAQNLTLGDYRTEMGSSSKCNKIPMRATTAHHNEERIINRQRKSRGSKPIIQISVTEKHSALLPKTGLISLTFISD